MGVFVSVCQNQFTSLTLSSDLLPLVIVALVIGYIDKDNKYASSEVKFGIAVCSTIPLSYYIGMGIARYVLFLWIKAHKDKKKGATDI